MESKKWREISQRLLCFNAFISTGKKIILSGREKNPSQERKSENKKTKRRKKRNREKKRNYQIQACDRHQLVQHQDKETFHR